MLRSSKAPSPGGIVTMRFKLAFFVLSLLCLPVPTYTGTVASAAAPPRNDQFVGNELLRKCNLAVKAADDEDLQAREWPDAWWCLGYLAGFTDAYVIASTL